MQKRMIIRSRKGFTLVEVALAVAVGLIIIGGAVLGYNAVKDNASNSNARNRVLSAVTMVEEYAAANGGSYPASSATAGAFSTMFAAKRPDDKALSPWGGATGDTTDGVTEFVAMSFGATAAPTTATATIVTATGVGTAVPGNAANMMYLSNTGASPWGGITASSTAAVVSVKNYAVGIYDKAGTQWWDVKGGK